MSGLNWETLAPRFHSIGAVKVTRENAIEVASVCGGWTWASAVILPDRTTAPVGSWVRQTGPRSWAVLTDEEIARWWVEVAEHG